MIEPFNVPVRRARARTRSGKEPSCLQQPFWRRLSAERVVVDVDAFDASRNRGMCAKIKRKISKTQRLDAGLVKGVDGGERTRRRRKQYHGGDERRPTGATLKRCTSAHIRSAIVLA